MIVGKKEKNVVFFATGTTGLFLAHHEVIEVALVNEDAEVLVHHKMNPRYPERMEPEARRVSGYYEDLWPTAPEFTTSWRDVCASLQMEWNGEIICGANLTFHLGMIDPYLRQYDGRKPSTYLLLDICSYAAGMLGEYKTFPQLCHKFAVSYDTMMSVLDKTKAAALLYQQLKNGQ